MGMKRSQSADVFGRGNVQFVLQGDSV
ncbi:uncharacterized protein [Blastocystis hominis]|uniref:Uncharacterized protein n=1 Tax=Blastocystis hominis TaxID=12968 RepID=D8M4K3_BLAHO|nr:uncharacterized protein [Blastocystis hominis]CBK22992.2 unnamed protein product [Blastocystis hominis]|eukprot:XP_012897040.1 uncharacterized protein [Blastocystis hominis]